VVLDVNPREFRTADIPARIRQAKPVHIEDMPEDSIPVSGKISSGQAFLKVVAYPWGVEFDICDGEGDQ